MKPWQKFAVALFTATALYGGQLRQWTDPKNRFVHSWETGDALALLAGIVLLAALALLVRAALQPWPRLRRMADHLWVFVLGVGLVSSLTPSYDYKTELTFLALAAALTASWFRPAGRLPARGARLALLFSPLPFVVGAQLLGYGEWRLRSETFPATSQPPRADAQPVFLFVFDEWSWARSTDRGELLPIFKNLREFAAHACTFDQARSPGPRTIVSLPRLIFQSQATMEIGPRATTLLDGARREPTATAPSIFTLARDRGYASQILGFYFPYRHMLGAQVDYALSFNIDPKRETLPGLLLDHALANVEFWYDPLSRRAWQAMEKSAAPASRLRYSEHWVDVNRSLEAATTRLIADAPANSLALIHYPLPHFPFIFNPDGAYRGPFPKVRKAHDPEGYFRHLAYLDLTLGRIIAQLKAAGKYDRALLIFTSDHSWREDYEFDGRMLDCDELRHVPLFIKLPGQREPRLIPERFVTSALRPLLDAAMRGEDGVTALTAALAESAAQLPALPPPLGMPGR